MQAHEKYQKDTSKTIAQVIDLGLGKFHHISSRNMTFNHRKTIGKWWFIGIYIDIYHLVGGDWNMTFIRKTIGKPIG